MLLPALKVALPIWAAEALSAVLFALAHSLLAGNPWAGVPALAGGLAFARLATRTGGILSPWFFHMAANGFVLGVQVLQAR